LARPPAYGGRARREAAPQETVAKVPLQASENAREWHGKGVELCFRAFLQQSPEQPDPEQSEGARPENKQAHPA